MSLLLFSLHNRYLFLLQSIKLIHQSIDFGFEAGDGGAVGVGEDGAGEFDDLWPPLLRFLSSKNLTADLPIGKNQFPVDR